jgi:hypothetical protein
MYVTETDYQVKKEYYKDQARAAQRYHRAKMVSSTTPPRHSLARALTWLGSQMADWGKSLQERYETAVTPTVPQPR